MYNFELTTREELYSLTELWKQSGKSLSYKPYNWMRKEGSAFIQFIKANGDCKAPLKTFKGKHGGTFAHWQIALAYAKYLSHELHMYVNQVFKDKLKKDKQPVPVNISTVNLDATTIGEMIVQGINTMFSPILTELKQLTESIKSSQGIKEIAYTEIIQGYKTLHEYCTEENIQVDRGTYQSISHKVRKQTLKASKEIKKKRDNRYGHVNAYPIEVLDEYFYG